MYHQMLYSADKWSSDHQAQKIPGKSDETTFLGGEQRESLVTSQLSRVKDWESRSVYRMSAKALGGLCLYGIIMTGSTAILAYLLTTSCGIDSEIKGSDKEVDNKIQKGLLNMDFSSSEKGSCEVGE